MFSELKENRSRDNHNASAKKETTKALKYLGRGCGGWQIIRGY
jgi:hypothetical protein